MELHATTADMQSLERGIAELCDMVNILAVIYKETGGVAANAATTGPMELEPASFADVCSGGPKATSASYGPKVHSSIFESV
ncbi:hypothetical protein LPJ73_002134 [Coemansia sp. RSA 2703]|nr:hypothetical protein LPJ73_002134 [Coemansia sp. RSA 2703]